MHPSERAFHKNYLPKKIMVKHDVPVAGQDEKGNPSVKNGVAHKVTEVQQSVNLAQWVDSYEANPNPDELHTVQVSSVKNLKERA